MVLATAGVNHVGFADFIGNAVAGQPVVNPPAGIVNLAGLAALGPPGVDIGNVSVHITEGVSEALVQ